MRLCYLRMERWDRAWIVRSSTVGSDFSLISVPDKLTATKRLQSSRGPIIAPSTPRHKIPPATAKPVKYGCPPLLQIKFSFEPHFSIKDCFGRVLRSCLTFRVCLPQFGDPISEISDKISNIAGIAGTF